MPKNIESGSSQDDTPEYRTAKGDKGLVFANPEKIREQLAHQEKLAQAKEKEIPVDIRPGTVSMVKYDIERDRDNQFQRIDNGEKYNKKLLEDLIAEQTMLIGAEIRSRDFKKADDWRRASGGSMDDYSRMMMKRTSAGEMIKVIEENEITPLESKKQLSEIEQRQLDTANRLIEKLGREALKENE